ncbi:MAG: DUF433 domain-containing protein [Alphaproteobacteria bacterium]
MDAITRPIVRDPEKYGGEPHVEGTTITVADVQEYWRQPGVYAAQIRERFPGIVRGRRYLCRRRRTRI